MIRDSSIRLLALIAGMVVLAAGVLVWRQEGDGLQMERAREFQTLTGGLGFGPALDLSGCAHSFDPRLCGDCLGSAEPLLGRQLLCPEQASSIFYYPRLRSGAWMSGER